MSVKRFAVFGLVALVGCAAPPPPKSPPESAASVSISTSVRGRNVDDIARDVREWHDVAHKDCQATRVVTAQIISQQGQWTVEHWTVEACGAQRFTYRVMIQRTATGIADAVGNVDGSGVKVAP
ncbi:MAG TPA: hypothetical protein VGV09_09435 [Steroidobacteraceae bacterium]|nr:hypothetical protein [Steroidobacteraceae bacterium]